MEKYTTLKETMRRIDVTYCNHVYDGYETLTDIRKKIICFKLFDALININEKQSIDLLRFEEIESFYEVAKNDNEPHSYDIKFCYKILIDGQEKYQKIIKKEETKSYFGLFLKINNSKAKIKIDYLNDYIFHMSIISYNAIFNNIAFESSIKQYIN